MTTPDPNVTTISQQLAALTERVALLERVVRTLTGTTSAASAMPPRPSIAQTVAAPVTTAAPAVKKTSAEVEIGQRWLSVVGIGLIFLAALFFVQYVFRFVGPLGKVLLSYLGAAVLFGVAFATKKKFPPFAAVVAAGAWGVTYLVTYAMHFFPATRLITSAPLAMFLLTLVVGLLLAMAVVSKARPLLVIGLVLGSLTLILSPLSLFSIFGTVALLLVGAFLAVYLPWGDYLLAATLGSFLSYFVWFSNVLGRLPAQGGGLLEKQMLGLAILVIMWLVIAATIAMRRDKEESLGGQVDALTLIIASAATVFLGVAALQDLVLVFTTPRSAAAIWFFLMAGLHGGWALIANEFREKKDVVTVGGLAALLLLMAGIASALSEGSSATALAWAVVGLAVVTAGVARQRLMLAATAILPLVAGALRFMATDLAKDPVVLSGTLSLTVLTGVAIALTIIGSAALLRILQSSVADQRGKHLAGATLALGILVLLSLTAREFSGVVPSVLWSLLGLCTVIAGFVVRWKDARVIGLLALALTVGRVFLHDLSGLEALPRVISFAVLGALLLMLGYGYNHNKEKLQKFLDEGE